MKNKFISLLLALVMVMSLAACGGKEEAPAEKPAETPAQSEQPAETPAEPAEPTEEPITLNFAYIPN